MVLVMIEKTELIGFMVQHKSIIYYYSIDKDS